MGDGIGTFGTGPVGGVASLVGKSSDDGLSWTWGTAGQAWGGMASGLGALAITGPITFALAAAPDDALPDWTESVSDWHTSTITAFGKGIVGSPEQWEEDPVAAGTTAVLNVATFFIPVVGQAAGGVKVTSSLARVGVSLERVAVRAGNGTRIAAGFSRAGTLAADLSTALHFVIRTTPDGLTVRDLDAAVAALDDIAPLKADILLPANVDAPPVERGSTDASTATPTRSDTNGTTSEGGSTARGGITVLERTDLGDNGSPSDRGGSADVPTDRGGSGDGPADRGESSTPSPMPSTAGNARASPENRVGVSASDAPGPRTPFAARTDLEPNTVYHVDGRGDFYTDATG